MTIVAPKTYRIASADAGAGVPVQTHRSPGRGYRVRCRCPSPAGGPGGTDTDTLLAAFAEQNLEVIDRVELEPELEPTARDGRRRSAAPLVPAQQEATVDVSIGADEDAELLVEQDGIFSWNLSASAQPSPIETRRGHPSRKIIRFTVEIRATREPSRSTRRGLVGEIVYDRIKVYALKFVARVGVGSGVRFLERNVRRLVQMRGLDPSGWTLTDPAQVALPTDRPARILLFVHGTFSSTIGSFGALSGPHGARHFFLRVRRITTRFSVWTTRRCPTIQSRTRRGTKLRAEATTVASAFQSALGVTEPRERNCSIA